MMYGQGRGFGFRGSSPPWPYVGRGRGGLPRCSYPGLSRGVPYGMPAFTSPGYDELDLLKNQADVLKADLAAVEQRISDLETKQE